MKFLFNLLIVVFIYSPCTAQDSYIQAIRKEYKQINQWIEKEALDLTEKQVEDEELHSTIEYYQKEKQLKLIKVNSHDASHAASETSYYNMNNGLMFIFHDFGYWQFSGMDKDGNSTTTDFVEETRCYFKDEKPIRCLSRKYDSTIDAKEAKNKKVDCLECLELLKEFKKLAAAKTDNRP